MIGKPHILYEPTQCTICGFTFPWSPQYFHHNKDRPTGCSQPCLNCQSVRGLEWAKTHKERKRIIAKKFYYDHREQERIRGFKYKEAHREQIRAKDRERCKANPIKERLASHKRRVRKRENLGTLTKNDIDLQYKGQKGKCWWCSKSLKKKYEIDHSIPLSREGAHDRKNIVISCEHCNRSKHNKLPQE